MDVDIQEDASKKAHNTSPGRIQEIFIVADNSNYTALAKLSHEINRLNNHLDARISAVENQLETNSEDRQELMRLNASISNTVKQAKQLQLDVKEKQLAAQRPPTTMGIDGYFDRSYYKHPATKAIEKWFRKQGDIGALTTEERSHIDFNRIQYDAFPPEQKVLVSAAADLGKQYLLR